MNHYAFGGVFPLHFCFHFRPPPLFDVGFLFSNFYVSESGQYKFKIRNINKLFSFSLLILFFFFFVNVYLQHDPEREPSTSSILYFISVIYYILVISCCCYGCGIVVAWECWWWDDHIGFSFSFSLSILYLSRFCLPSVAM